MNNFDRLQDRLDELNKFERAALDSNICMPEYPTAAEMVTDFVLLANCLLDLRQEIVKRRGGDRGSGINYGPYRGLPKL